mgnify:CR=1 FL=1
MIFQIIRDLFVQINFYFEKRIKVGKKRTQRPVSNLAPLHQVHRGMVSNASSLRSYRVLAHAIPAECFSTHTIDLIIHI